MKRITKLALLFLTVLGLNNVIVAQSIANKQDSLIYQDYIKKSQSLSNEPINLAFLGTARYFMGKPYVAFTLDKEETEQLVVNLREFDCTTFIENCIALAKEIGKGDQNSFSGFKNTLQSLRYRKGQIKGYSSRIHYTTDWIFNNNEVVENMTIKFGGAVIKKPINFMSGRSQLYPKLRNDIAARSEMFDVEDVINARKDYSLIPVSKIESATKQMKDGDIVAFGSKTKGLDYSHIGIVFWQDNKLMLLHASSGRRNVVIDNRTLIEYCKASKSCAGISVLRLKDYVLATPVESVSVETSAQELVLPEGEGANSEVERATTPEVSAVEPASDGITVIENNKGVESGAN